MSGMKEGIGRFVHLNEVPPPSQQIPGFSQTPANLPHPFADIDGQICDHFRALQNGFQKLDKVKDINRRSKQLEELSVKMRECKRLLKEFDQEIKDEESRSSPELKKLLQERKQSLIKELNTYVTLRKTYANDIDGKKAELFEGRSNGDPYGDENARMASTMSNQELINAGNKQMDETDQAIDRAKKVVVETIGIGEQTAQSLKAQTEQLGRIVNELDTIQFSIKKGTKVAKEIGRQLATDRCIMCFLFLIVCGVVAIIIVKIVNPNNKDIRDIPGLAPPANGGNRKLLTTFNWE